MIENNPFVLRKDVRVFENSPDPSVLEVLVGESTGVGDTVPGFKSVDPGAETVLYRRSQLVSQ